MSKRAPKSNPVIFVNNKGHVLHLDGNLRLDDLVDMGVELSLASPDEPLKKGEWKSVNIPDTFWPK